MKNIQSFDEFTKDLNESYNINENYMKVKSNIKDDLSKFLNEIVITKSNGYIKNERDAGLLLYDILKDIYVIGGR